MADKKQFKGRVEAIGTFNYISDPVSVQAATTLTKNQSGAAVLVVPPNDVILPSASPAGQRFEFVLAADVSSGTSTVKTAGGNFIGGIATGNSAHKEQAPSPCNTATFTGAANAGDRFECVSDGTNWYIVGGYCEEDDGLTFTNV